MEARHATRFNHLQAARAECRYSLGPPSLSPAPFGHARSSALDRQAVDHLVVIGLARIDPRRQEFGLVGRIGEFLRLQRNAVAHAVEMTLDRKSTRLNSSH